MSGLELIAAAMSASVAILTVLIGSWFGTRVHRLESRVDELETDQYYLRKRERQLEDFIYRHDLVPPEPPERDS